MSFLTLSIFYFKYNKFIFEKFQSFSKVDFLIIVEWIVINFLSSPEIMDNILWMYKFKFCCFIIINWKFYSLENSLSNYPHSTLYKKLSFYEIKWNIFSWFYYVYRVFLQFMFKHQQRD